VLAELNREDKITVLVSLHQVEYALAYCPRTIALRDGRIVYDGASSALTPAFLSELYGAESEELFLPTSAAAATDRINSHVAAARSPATAWTATDAVAAGA
jgi:phosphonate transport system ATP-binding protein